ncbi:hypothetical protein HOY82DRAFT_592247 [Tuber indicum]|nr:hypothetical protein HOY82DRAFT_592247 [Tuber indicum]
MARSWSQSPASLNSVFSVLNSHGHPFVMVGKYALRWMGVPAYTGYTVDILVRTTQLVSIHQAFIQTGEWREVDESCTDELDLEFHAVEHRSVRKLKRFDDDWFLSLCDEGSCSLAVDTKKIQVPHVVNCNSVLVESEFHPDSSDRSVRPYLITECNIKFAGDQPITFPIFIPTIPQFLDSCLDCIGDGRSSDDGSYSLPQIDMDNLARYLVLDSPDQQAKLLAKVKNREGLTQYFEKRRRNQERGMKRVMERQIKRQVDASPGRDVPSVEVPL